MPAAIWGHVPKDGIPFLKIFPWKNFPSLTQRNSLTDCWLFLSCVFVRLSSWEISSESLVVAFACLFSISFFRSSSCESKKSSCPPGNLQRTQNPSTVCQGSASLLPFEDANKGAVGWEIPRGTHGEAFATGGAHRSAWIPTNFLLNSWRNQRGRIKLEA